MLTFPHIDPVALSLGPLKIHWYGVMYLLSFLVAWGLALWRVKRYELNWTSEQVGDLVFYAAMGVIIGGRLGYMVFYATRELITEPWSVFKLWDGGMSFHGGLLGVISAMVLFGRKSGKGFWAVADFTALFVPLGLAFGRLGNFINGELWGRVTDKPWGMIFPQTDGLARHPSQLYELALEGVLLFVLLWWYARIPRKKGRVSALFLILYGVFRFSVEFFRQPDANLGFVALDWLSMGQVLSLPMVMLGLIIFFTASQRES